MKRWLIAVILLVAVAVGGVVWQRLSAPSAQSVTVGTAELGLLLLDTDDGVSVLGVQERSIAEQAGIRPGDVLLQFNETSLRTAETLDTLLMHGSGENRRLDLQRGMNVFSVHLPPPPNVH